MSESPALFRINPTYRLGDTLHLDVESLREQAARARNEVEHVEVRVEHVDDDGVRLRWTPRWTEVIFGPDPPPLDIDPALLRELSGLEFEISLDERGRLMGITNEVIILDALERCRRAILPGKAGELFSARTLFSKLRRPVDLYFGVSGKIFPIAEPLRRQIAVPNPFGGEPCQADYSIVAETVGAEVLLHARTVTASTEVLAQFAKAGGFPRPEGLAAHVVDQAEYTVDAASGRTRTVRFTRTTGQTGDRDLDFLEIRLRD